MFYDFICPKCNKEETDVKLTLKEFEDGYLCKECNVKMKTKIALTSFKLLGRGWFSDGYSKVQKVVDKCKRASEGQ